MITSAMGSPTPKVPPIVNANAESKFASAWTIRLDIPLLHQAPTSIARRPRMNDKKHASGQRVTGLGCLCIRKALPMYVLEDERPGAYTQNAIHATHPAIQEPLLLWPGLQRARGKSGATHRIQIANFDTFREEANRRITG
jgi:hypothetical protein